MTSASRIVGIDLGTSNCAVAFADPSQGAGAPVIDFAIAQLVQPGQVAPRPLLPSTLYVPGEHELAPGATGLPWGDSPGMVAGEFARWQGARVPGRLVASAKSWLCHSGVDRSAPILPWGAPAGMTKISPVHASALLLGHIASAWNHAHPEAPLAEQEVIVTVPASFDEVARALTVNAAREAGLEKFTLVEEPQAAFYDFSARHRDDLAEALSGVRLVLVVDVGGGTLDLTLIEVGVDADGPALRRIAVGDHLMLGGDNMDAALARMVEERLSGDGRKLGAMQWTQLVQATRAAKEILLGEDGPERHRITLAGEGSRLIGRTLSTDITRGEAERLLLDGFLPFCASDDIPQRAPRIALQEFGLPFAQDPAITRHVVGFLRQHAAAAFAALGSADGEDRSLPRPDAILLNGGVFNASRIRDRLVEVLSSWWPESPPLPLLQHDSLDRAVARGAACYGLVRRGLGRRIAGGAARALYVGMAGKRDDDGTSALCLIPRGHEEGHPLELNDRSFTLALGRPVQFPLFSTTSDRIDRAGDLVAIDDSFHALPPIHTLLKGAGTGKTVPVHLRATLTELGTLELSCVSNVTDERWRLEFELRAAGARNRATVTESMPAQFDDARAVVDRVFGSKPQQVDLKEVKDIVRTLERAIGPRETWSLPLLREFWGTLFAGAKRRRRSEHHERVFLQLTGYCLRPGFGYPLDEWRCEQTFALFAEGVAHGGDQKVWREFWVLWRRIAGGLEEPQHAVIWSFLKPHLARRIPPQPPKNLPKPKGVQPEGLDEMVRTAASLEHLDAAEKVLLGNWITERIQDPGTRGGPWAWALGRLGARVPIFGSGHRTVDPGQAQPWLEMLLQSGLGLTDGSAFAAVQIARLTGDRTRDLDEDILQRTLRALRSGDTPERWLQVLRDVTALEAADEARALGDTLPIGLMLH